MGAQSPPATSPSARPAAADVPGQQPGTAPSSTGTGGGGGGRSTLSQLRGGVVGLLDTFRGPSAAPLGTSTQQEPLAEPPDEFVDPISQELMLDPVLLVETGQSYERATIEAWFEQCSKAGRPCTDPLTRKELRHTTMVPNFSLKSLINSWSERRRIKKEDLPTFSKAVAKQRTLARSPSGSTRPSSGSGGGSGGGSPGEGGAGEAAEGLAGLSLGAGSPARPPRPSRQRQEPEPLYPSVQHPSQPVVSKTDQAETALAALRESASVGGSSGAAGTRGAASYHAWSLMQLAGDAVGRQLLYESNAIPLAIYLLGKPADDSSGLDAARPSLCGILQRLAARDADVASSIAQCGGIQVLVSQLTSTLPAVRAAACRALYFLGWQGSPIRAAMLEALAQHAVACSLPAQPLLAFWRLWERPEQSSRSGAGGAKGGDGAGANGSVADVLAAGREGEWEALALLLHMLADGCSHAVTAAAAGAGGSSEPASPKQHSQLALLDVTGTAIPAVLAHVAAASDVAAASYAASTAALLLAQLPQNLPLLLEGAMEVAWQAAGDGSGSSGGTTDEGSMVAGNAAWLLWQLSFCPAHDSSLPAAARAAAQHINLLLPGLEAALYPDQKPDAACRELAAGLLACLLYEPPTQQLGSPGAAYAADAMRCLLASPPAAGVLQSLLCLLQPRVASVHPQAAQAAALAVANMAAYRGTKGPSPAGTAALPEASSGRLTARISATLHSLRRSNPGSGDHAASPRMGEPAPPPQPTEPRAALLYYHAVPLLLGLVLHCSAAAAAADAAASSGASAAAGPANPAARQQAAAAAAAAAETAAHQRQVLAATLQAVNNLCVDPAAVSHVRHWARPAESNQQLTAALMAGMADPHLPAVSREQARLLLHTASGAPGQRHALGCSLMAPPPHAPAYPNP